MGAAGASTHHLLPTMHHLPPTTYHLPPTTYYLLLTTPYLEYYLLQVRLEPDAAQCDAWMRERLPAQLYAALV